MAAITDRHTALGELPRDGPGMPCVEALEEHEIRPRGDVGNVQPRETVSESLTKELLDRASTMTGADVRLGGKVAAGTVKWDQVGGLLEFHVTDGAGRLPVSYRGVVPDTFKPGADVVVEGTYDGTQFTAVRLFAKCPSKFEAKAEE